MEKQIHCWTFLAASDICAGVCKRTHALAPASLQVGVSSLSPPLAYKRTPAWTPSQPGASQSCTPSGAPQHPAASSSSRSFRLSTAAGAAVNPCAAQMCSTRGSVCRCHGAPKTTATAVKYVLHANQPLPAAAAVLLLLLVLPAAAGIPPLGTRQSLRWPGTAASPVGVWVQ